MITSNNNAKVKQVVQWQTKAKERRKDHVFLAEGIRMCEEAPVKNVREVYLTEELEQKIRQNAQNGDTAIPRPSVPPWGLFSGYPLSTCQIWHRCWNRCMQKVSTPMRHT